MGGLNEIDTPELLLLQLICSSARVYTDPLPRAIRVTWACLPPLSISSFVCGNQIKPFLPTTLSLSGCSSCQNIDRSAAILAPFPHSRRRRGGGLLHQDIVLFVHKTRPELKLFFIKFSLLLQHHHRLMSVVVVAHNL